MDVVRRVISGLAILLAISGFILHHSGGGAASAFTGPLDVAGNSLTDFYSLRAGSAALAAAGTRLANIKNTVTNETCDVNAATSGDMGLTANCSGSTGHVTASSFCTQSGGVNCTGVTWYSQLTANNMTMTGSPVLKLTGANGKPTFEFTSNAQFAQSASITPNSNRLLSITEVANYVTSGSATTLFSVTTNILLVGSTGGGSWFFSGSAGQVTATASNGTLHTANCALVQGGTSFFYLDETETTNTGVSGTFSTGPLEITSGGSGGSATTIDVSEVGWANGVAWSDGVGSVPVLIQANQKSYWGTQ